VNPLDDLQPSLLLYNPESVGNENGEDLRHIFTRFSS